MLSTTRMSASPWSGRRTACLAVAMLALLAGGAGHLHAQAAARARAETRAFDLLERPTRLLVGWPRQYLFEAEPNLSIYLLSRATALSAIMAPKPPKTASSGCWKGLYLPFRILGKDTRNAIATGCSLALTPRFVIRQQAESSAAVNPASFNPQLDLCIVRLRRRENAAHGTLHMAKIRVAHYSNGQAGCLYTHSVRPLQEDGRADFSKPCVDFPNIPDSLNLDDGDFSTTYTEFGYSYGWFGMDAKGIGLGWILRGEVSAIAHKLCPGFGCISREQSRTYGTLEFPMSVSASRWSDRAGGIQWPLLPLAPGRRIEPEATATAGWGGRHVSTAAGRGSEGVG